MRGDARDASLWRMECVAAQTPWRLLLRDEQGRGVLLRGDRRTEFASYEMVLARGVLDGPCRRGRGADRGTSARCSPARSRQSLWAACQSRTIDPPDRASSSLHGRAAPREPRTRSNGG